MTDLKIACYACNKYDHVIKYCPSLHFIISPYHYLKMKNKCAKVIMKQFVRKDRVQFHALAHKDLINESAESLQRLNNNFFFQKVEWDLTQDDTQEDLNINEKVNEIQDCGNLVTKFKEDRKEIKKMKTIIKKQSCMMDKLSINQNLQTQLFQSSSFPL